MHAAALYSKYVHAPKQNASKKPAPKVNKAKQQVAEPAQPPPPTYSAQSLGAMDSLKDELSNNSLGYVDGSTQSFLDQANSDQSFMGPSKSTEHLHQASPAKQQAAVATGAPTTATPVPSYQRVKVNPAVTISTKFYVPANTLVQVSSGDDQWSSGYWRDNHRAINVLESSIQKKNDAEGEQQQSMMFVRLADVALNDEDGHAMYLAANRHRPCYVALTADTQLYYNAAEVQQQGGNAHHNGHKAGESDFEAADVGALQSYFASNSPVGSNE